MDSAQNPTPGSMSRKELGAFYTPDAVVAHMVKQLSVTNLSGRILEPSGGDGAIVRGLLNAGATPDQITVWDINPDVKEPLAALGVNVEIGDALARTSQAGAYHAVVGNPPYLNKQSDYIKANRDWLRKKYSAIGANDTYAMFTWFTAQHITPGGQLVFLISDTFFSLGIHRKFRHWLLSNTRIDSLTLLPKDTFPGASVNTVILAVTMDSAPANHLIKVFDARATGIDDMGTPSMVPQAEILATPAHVFLVKQQDRLDLALAATLPKLTEIVDGGLGMFTRDNAAYLAVVKDGGVPRAPIRKGQATVEAKSVTGTRWRWYHKRGGDQRWIAPAEHAVKWDKKSRTQYTTPSSATAGRLPDGTPRDGVAVSGVTARFAARLATYDAMWESNKVFCLFPKDPETHSPLFLLAILNSDRYVRLAGLTNHTVSLQIRDIQALPLLPFTDNEMEALAGHAQAAVEATLEGLGTDDAEAAINRIVDRAWERAKARSLKTPDGRK